MSTEFTRETLYGGTKFKITGSADISTSILVPNHAKVTEYISYLSSVSYGEYYMRNMKQEVLDALSPFQIMSKLWLACMLTCRNIQHWGRMRDPKRVMVVGSWFGQMVPLVKSSTFPIWENASEIQLIDKDPTSTFIAKRGMELVMPELPIRAIAKSIFDIPPAEADTLVIWTGIEHFENVEVADWIKRSDNDCVFVLQGTDMPGDDHVNPVVSSYDLTHYFHAGQLLYKGRLTCDLGSRHMVAYKT